MRGELLAWRVEVAAFDIVVYVAAERRGRARMVAARSMVDAGYVRTIGRALTLRIRVTREPGRDHEAAEMGRRGYLPRERDGIEWA